MSSFDQIIYKQCKEPFPHLILKNFYDEEELKMIWQELKFLTKPGKLLSPKDYGGIDKSTTAKALILDEVYGIRRMSNILKCYRKIFDERIIDLFSEIHGCCSIFKYSNDDCTKIRYYHDGEYYKPHTDGSMNYLAFSYFYKEPKKFIGGELEFPKYNYEFPCTNNSLILMPAWVEHGVKKVEIKDSDYYDGNGRYAITTFINILDIVSMRRKRKEMIK
tara:strand:- start:43 stop:699 length:657 start_codon:yes stop_codon:yes gene_type:complete